jgi:hypothetical protein
MSVRTSISQSTKVKYEFKSYFKELKDFTSESNPENISIYDLIDKINNSNIGPPLNHINYSNKKFEFNFYNPLSSKDLEIFDAIISSYKTQTYENTVILLTEQQNIGKDGGDFNADVWQARRLNVISGNKNMCGLDIEKSTFSLQPGKYYINATAQVGAVGNHRLRIFNIDDNVAILYGENALTRTPANLISYLEIGKQTIYQLQHRCSITQTTTGFGSACGFDDNICETYCTLRIIPLYYNNVF